MRRIMRRLRWAVQRLFALIRFEWIAVAITAIIISIIVGYLLARRMALL
jgi:hypothetical protein